MILQALTSYYRALRERGEAPEPGWSYEKVHYALNIAPDGTLKNVVSLLTEDTRGKKKDPIPRALLLPMREVRASGTKANLLCDNTGYLLGFDKKGKPARTLECYEACKALHLEVLHGVEGEAAAALRAFFERWDPTSARSHPALADRLDDFESANLVFQIDGKVFAQDDPFVREACQTYYDSKAAPEALCLITGDVGPLVELHPKIKGVRGAQGTGASLVSYNASAYESYGMTDVEHPNAPVGRYAAFAYTTALNLLLADEKHCTQIGETMYVYWSEKANPIAQDIFSWSFDSSAITEDTDAALDDVMKRLASGRPIDGVDINERFYVLGVAPNAARLSVRLFVQDSFGHMLENMLAHHERLRIVHAPYEKRYLALRDLLYETVNPNARSKAASPLMSGATLRAILTGTPYPLALYQAALLRVRAERRVTRGRAAIIKACLTMQSISDKEVLTVGLNEASTNRAYTLGRLFAVLEDAQTKANPGINATIKDRYLTSACAAPGIVFPTLLKLSVHHTAKAEYGGYLEQQKGKLLDMLAIEDNPFPAHHNLTEQGEFLLGYYQQVQARYRKKDDPKKEEEPA